MKKNQIFDSNSLDIQKRVCMTGNEGDCRTVQHTDVSWKVSALRGDTHVHPTAAADLSHTQLFCPLITGSSFRGSIRKRQTMLRMYHSLAAY